MSDAVHDYTTEVLDWRPFVRPIDLETATPEQLEALKITPANKKVSDYVLTLAHDPESLLHRSPLFNGIMYGRDGLDRGGRELGAIGSSIVNRCIYCIAVHARHFNQATKTTEIVEEIFAHETEAKLPAREQAIFDFSVKLSAFPPAATAQDMGCLKAVGLDETEILDLILSTAIFGWANRLMHTLGEPISHT
ncbi:MULTISPECIES: peroxidase-related enzyme [unclassified Rhizobium]|uniref:peroxidase-related enzyme n=1 Tax=unclassified Rhizobium TaxID=2613769 RepID=UPI001AD9CDE9|nr:MULTISPECIES: peroxidase-related enzyme [unclassified Rhizobium]MBO9123921.1 peroxidase-related enzyme [Rhizobium sp. 16-488-2b]MBO9174453.1 peroxidase-related enzyme [Rhizobium sp. 16-488-2a]